VSQLDQADQATFAQEDRQAEAARAVSGAGQTARFIDALPLLAGRELAFDLLQGPGGSAAVDAAFARPPRTSEQAFDPDAYATAEEPLALAALPVPDGRIVDSGRFGYVDSLVTLFPGVDVPNGRASPEWGGGRFQTWRTEGGGLCVHARVAGDDEAQTAELLSRFQGWADRVGFDATAEATPDAGIGRTAIDLRRCT
jgi:hypothetical protein